MRPRLDGRTVGVAIGAWVVVAGSVGALATDRVGWPMAMALSTVGCFAAFTPVHEAAHFNVSRHRWLNDGVGRACALLLLGGLGPYRFLHGLHHRHPNEPGRDPDLWSAGRRPLLRWATSDLGYLRAFAQARRPLREWVELIVVAVGAAALLGWVGTPLLLGWLLPARIALTVLAATFAWWPHAPHLPGDRYRATSVRSDPVWTVLLFAQNYHLVHHLWPHLPFYRLPATWRRHRAALHARGAVDYATPNGPRAAAAARITPETGGSTRNGASRSSAAAV